MDALLKHTNKEKGLRTNTPQTMRTPGRTDEVRNRAGGYVFSTSDKQRLERFLILGTTGGTYYVGESKLTSEEVNFVTDLISRDEATVLDTLVDVSVNGRAVRQTPTLFTLAAVMVLGNDKARATEAVSKVVRTSTHLFEFAQFIDDLGGWGRAKRRAVANWYESKDAEALAYQAVKYRQRNGWTHRDLLRLSHARPDSAVAEFILGRGTGEEVEILRGFQAVQRASTARDAVRVLRQHPNLPWETVPTEFLKSVEVWRTIFNNGQLQGQALVRNVTRLARLGAFKNMDFAAEYAARLTDEEMIRRTRLHPINLLNALVVYNEGQAGRGSGMWGYAERTKDWETNSVIAAALDDAFHTSFKTIEPAGKRTLIGVDVSGSMSWSAANGLDLTAAQVSAAVAMTVARTEPKHMVYGFADRFRDLGVSARDSLDTVMRKVQSRTFGRTDMAKPMEWAQQNGVEVDTFVVITDNETYAGRTKPAQALAQYRKATGIDARLAVLGVASGPFTIADPNDPGMMDFVGFDSNGPRVLADFSAGRL